jgi:hypothetical protein
MRPFIVSALATTLIGCTGAAPKQTQQTSLMGYGAASALQMDSKTVAKTNRAIAAKKTPIGTAGRKLAAQKMRSPTPCRMLHRPFSQMTNPIL